MNLRIAVPMSLLLLAAISCKSGERTTALRPVSQTSAASSQAAVVPAPAPVVASAPADANSAAGVRTLVAPGARGQITRSTDENDNPCSRWNSSICPAEKIWTRR